ncbi:hypothetical protein L1049_020289 [Liquidambar formosana]|uniref:Peptide chain release factor domain-containing protein n=1 Tax=Liquidambar formosana TaxID=63359 RepID=A0AAP0S6Y9_LIQFO
MKYPSGSQQSLVLSRWFVSQSRHFSNLKPNDAGWASGYGVLKKNITGFSSNLLETVKVPFGSHEGIVPSRWFRFFGSQAAIEPSTSDGLTVEGILANQWTIHDESESDWKSHAAAIAQSIHLIKKRLQWKKLVVRLHLLSLELDKPDLWDDPVHAGKISREHGSLMGKMKEVKGFEQELLEHIDMIKLAREENDTELESESSKALLRMRKNSKEKELEALLAGEQDSCSCYIEVQGGAGGTESMDWAAMVMQMYKMWARRRGYGVTVVEEMPGEIAGIKVHLLTVSHLSLFLFIITDPMEKKIRTHTRTQCTVAYFDGWCTHVIIR